MKLGVFDPVLGHLDFEPMLDRIVELGLQAVELGTGNSPGDRHCKPSELLGDEAALGRFRDSIESRGIVISALSCQGNPVHPVTEVARTHDEVFRNTVRLAERLEVGVVNVFSGCPGDGRGSRTPVWNIYPWPDEHDDVLTWQWEEALIPYWKDAGQFAADHGIALGFEMHPNFSVYNPPTWRRLRAAVGESICINLDPSHLFWQGIDVIGFIHEYGHAIVHVDCKDTAMEAWRISRDGLLDTSTSRTPQERSWLFRSVGYGNDILFWKRFVSALRLVGYDHVLSIEHEDPLASAEEGLAKAISVLREAMFAEPANARWN